MAARQPGPPREGPVVPYLRMLPPHKEQRPTGAVTGQIAAGRHPKTDAQSAYKSHVLRHALETCGRLDGFRIVTTRTVEEPLADQENRFSLSILARAATRQWTSPRITVWQTSVRYTSPLSAR